MDCVLNNVNNKTTAVTFSSERTSVVLWMFGHLFLHLDLFSLLSWLDHHLMMTMSSPSLTRSSSLWSFILKLCNMKLKSESYIYTYIDIDIIVHVKTREKVTCA